MVPPVFGTGVLTATSQDLAVTTLSHLRANQPADGIKSRLLSGFSTCRASKLLRDSGYTESTSLPIIWTDPIRRQAFSEDCVNDHDEAWLHAQLAEVVPVPEFWFHFRYLSNNPIKDCKEILSSLKLTAHLPIVRTGVRHFGTHVSS